MRNEVPCLERVGWAQLEKPHKEQFFLTAYSLYKHGDFREIENFSKRLQVLALERDGIYPANVRIAVLSSPSGRIQSSSFALAEHFSKSINHPHVPLIAKRRVHSSQYTKLASYEARSQERKAAVVESIAKEEYDHYVLVEDCIATGTTVEHIRTIVAPAGLSCLAIMRLECDASFESWIDAFVPHSSGFAFLDSILSDSRCQFNRNILRTLFWHSDRLFQRALSELSERSLKIVHHFAIKAYENQEYVTRMAQLAVAAKTKKSDVIFQAPLRAVAPNEKPACCWPIDVWAKYENAPRPLTDNTIPKTVHSKRDWPCCGHF